LIAGLEVGVEAEEEIDVSAELGVDAEEEVE
jgi:hypothetical protein